MRILHISLGLPPLRSGGLTRYCTELMEAQSASGHQVSLLFPGRFKPGLTHIRKDSWHGIPTYEVINPLPVALTYGIAEPAAFCTSCNAPDAYSRILEELSPEVIHVHSFQGIHREFFEAAFKMGVPSVFTTHDYYPICPRCTLITSWGESCETGPTAEACAICNAHAGMTMRRSRVMQSSLYARIKGSKLMRVVGPSAKRRMRKDYSSTSVNGELPSPSFVAEFQQLLTYNRSYLPLLSLALANSSVAMDVYRQNFPDARFELFPITHSGLERNAYPPPTRSNDAPLRIGYFGGEKEYKGYRTLLDAAGILDSDGIHFEMLLYGDEYGSLPDSSHAISRGRIAPEEIPDALRALDLVVVPSKYQETFGFVVLEALCNRVPVICSDVVGAKDLVNKEYVFRVGDAQDLANKIERFCIAKVELPSVPEGYPLSMSDEVERLTRAYLDAERVMCHPA